MTKTQLLLAAATVALAVGATPALARPMTATDMHMMHRLGAPEVSPDGRHALMSISNTDLAANKRNNALYLLDLTAKGATPQPVAALNARKGHDAVFGADGSIYFLAEAGGSDQLWRMAMGGTPVQISTLKGDVGGFKLAPTGDRIVIWADRDLRCTDFACADLPAKAATGSARVYDEMFVRHWDSWVEPGVRSRLFSFAIEGGKLIGTGIPLTGALIGDTPGKPFGDGSEIDFSRDGRTVFFTLREAGRIEPTSTNLDIFMAPADGTSAPTNLTDPNDATDTLPAVSPDGRTLAYVAMARPGFEADRQVIQLRDLASGQVRALTQSWDRSVDGLAWSPDGKALIVTADDTLEHPIFRVDVATGKIVRLTKDGHAGNVRPLVDGSILYTSNSVNAPDDLYRLDRRGKIMPLTSVNAALLGQLDPVVMTRYSFAGASGDKVWGYRLKPVGATGKLPIAFVVHGGPQGSFGNAWSFRWNPRLFTAPGYAVVSVDFHGSTGYGQAFTDSISNDWGGKPLEDLKLGLAAATAADPQLDADRACALGASYGGYMVNWIAGNWSDRFRCLVQHDGVFDSRAMAYETEELWFDEWEHGGTPYDQPAAYEKYNPVLFVAQWKTPMLVITGEQDFRIPYTQGLASFTALQRRNIPSKLLVFPDENHWVLKPRNSIQWYGEVFGWMNRWLGK